MQLRYLIGADGPWDGKLIMAPRGDVPAPRRGHKEKYVHLYRKDGEPRRYGPYLSCTFTTRECGACPIRTARASGAISPSN